MSKTIKKINRIMKKDINLKDKITMMINGVNINSNFGMEILMRFGPYIPELLNSISYNNSNNLNNNIDYLKDDVWENTITIQDLQKKIINEMYDSDIKLYVYKSFFYSNYSNEYVYIYICMYIILA